ncbi:MAG: hypothetical protein LBQ89_05005 [Treponema sp.]|jgi:hypothetical protein|nr:hypothetical protein [Treponema sp.]
MKRNLMFAFVLAGAALIFSCAEEDNGSVVDFTSRNTDFSILVRNNTSERLVAFKGDLLGDKLIGGIPARATNHGLPKDPALFDKTEDFPMILLTEAQYEANKSSLSSLKNTPFTRVYVFYNKSGDNTIVYEIAEGLGGNNSLTIINNSNSINVELRLGGAAGETIGYAPAGIIDTTLKLHDGNYNIFPVFKRYNTYRDVVETVYPQGAGSGYAWFRSYSFGEGTDAATMNLKDILQNVSFVSGAAWVVINNQTPAGIRFVEGSNVRTTASGLTNIMNSGTRTFQIDMPKAGERNYAESITVANWKFGTVGFEVGLRTNEDDGTPLASLKIEQGKMYTITVSGDHNESTTKAWVSEETEIPSDEIGGKW